MQRGALLQRSIFLTKIIRVGFLSLIFTETKTIPKPLVNINHKLVS